MRLTHYDEHKKRWQINDDYGAVMIDELNYAVGEAIDKLAAYEDAEEQGLLVILPQKTVYAIGWGEGKDCDHICPAKIDGVGCCSLCDNGELIVYEEECHQEHLPSIGKTVFLTREEAEAALKGEPKDV